MARRILAKAIVVGAIFGWSAVGWGSEWDPVLAQAQQQGQRGVAEPPKVNAVTNYLWESIVVILVSVAGLYAVCRTSRRQ